MQQITNFKISLVEYLKIKRMKLVQFTFFVTRRKKLGSEHLKKIHKYVSTHGEEEGRKIQSCATGTGNNFHVS